MFSKIMLLIFYSSDIYKMSITYIIIYLFRLVVLMNKYRYTYSENIRFNKRFTHCRIISDVLSKIKNNIKYNNDIKFLM